MATVMEMPKLSDTMSEGSIARWLKKEGDKVAAGMPIVEIDTDKATMEYEAPAGGILLKILVGDGQKCPLQSPIAVIGSASENWQDILNKQQQKTTTASRSSNAHHDNVTKSEIIKDAPQVAKIPATPGHLKASPLAKKIAADKGINLATIQGSGPAGRIVQRDVENVVAVSSVILQVPVSSKEVVRVPHTNMRKTIARRLSESVTTAPHFYLTININMQNIINWRKDILAKISEDAKFSLNDVVVFLVGRALTKHPMINASWQDDCIVQYPDAHVGMAVALPNGLITPVIRNANTLSLLQIAQETRRLVKLAKAGKLQPSDYTGSTFSTSNLGASGIEEFTAIINPPEAAILAIGAVIPTPAVNAAGGVIVEQRMKVTLSCDHRVIDGATGAEFLKTLKQSFEDPMTAFFFG